MREKHEWQKIPILKFSAVNLMLSRFRPVPEKGAHIRSLIEETVFFSIFVFNKMLKFLSIEKSNFILK